MKKHKDIKNSTAVTKNQKNTNKLDNHKKNDQIDLKDKHNNQTVNNDGTNQKQTELSKKGNTIRQDCMNQNQKFKKWANSKSWSTFHSSHYDWWAFPIDQNSGSYGSAYKVQEEDKRLLINDHIFLKVLHQNCVLVCRSWGWNLQHGKSIQNPDKEQKWQRWPIRLSKMCRSLKIFKDGNRQIQILFTNAIKYSILILSEYKKLTYGGKDLSLYFIQKDKEIKEQKKGKVQQNLNNYSSQKRQQIKQKKEKRQGLIGDEYEQQQAQIKKLQENLT